MRVYRLISPSLLFLLRLSWCQSLTQGFCYYPHQNDTKAEEYRACDATAPVSLCCPVGWTCFSNNLCVVTDSDAVQNQYQVGTSRRGGCTDPDWNNSTCGDFCLDNPNSDNDGLLVACGNDVYCCNADAKTGRANCAAHELVFTLTPGTAKTIISSPGSTATNTPLVPVSNSATTTSSSQTAVSTSATPTSSPTATPAAAAGKKSTSIGLGVGLGIGIPFIAAIAFIIWRRRNRNRDNAAMVASQPPPVTQIPGYKLSTPFDDGDNTTLAPNDRVPGPGPLPPSPDPYSPPSSPPPPTNVTGSAYNILNSYENDNPYRPRDRAGMTSSPMYNPYSRPQ